MKTKVKLWAYQYSLGNERWSAFQKPTACSDLGNYYIAEEPKKQTC